MSQLEFKTLKETKIKDFINYRNSFDIKKYSNNNWIRLNNILNNGIINITSANTVEQINSYFEESVALLNAVLTLEDEEKIKFDDLKNAAIINLADYFNNINLDLYSSSNKSLIRGKYNEYFILLKNTNNEDAINNIIIAFENSIKDIMTISQEYKIELDNSKMVAINNINVFYDNLYVYDYDSSNRLLIEEIIDDAINNIENELEVKNIQLIEEKLYFDIDKIPTMHEQAISNLPSRIERAVNLLEDYYISLNKNNYSEMNWNNIYHIVNEGKEYFKNNITVTTTDSQVNKMIDDIVMDINEILTVEEEYSILLEKTKKETINEINEYYEDNINNYNEEQISLITNRINCVIEDIKKLNNIENVIKLKNDTISAIESLNE